MSKITWLVVVILCTSIASAQEQNQRSAAKTKIEAFESQAGSVIVRGFSTVGELHGVYGGILTVQSIEFTNATSGKKEYGVSIDVKETDRLERSNRSFIDYDEIDGLLKGIDYVSKLDKAVTTLGNFQADFRTRGDLGISTFNIKEGNMATVSSGSIGATSLYLRIDDSRESEGLDKPRETIVGYGTNSLSKDFNRPEEAGRNPKPLLEERDVAVVCPHPALDCGGFVLGVDAYLFANRRHAECRSR